MPSVVLTVVGLAVVLVACGDAKETTVARTASTFVTTSSAPLGADLGVVHTPLGDAHARCNGQDTQSCDTVELNYDVCTAPIEAFIDSIRGPRLSELDRTVREIVGRKPPNGGNWSGITCTRPEKPKAESASPATSTTTTVRPCGPSEEGCTSAQVIATVEQVYVKAGATAVEARCIAPITGTGRSAVNQAFDVPKPGEEAAAIKCVGSEARLRAIAVSLAEYFKQHPFG